MSNFSLQNVKKPKIKWDKWQKDVLAVKGNVTIRAGRQVGKSEVISQRAVQFALDNPHTTTLIIAASQRQSSMLFEKVRDKLDWMKNIYLDQPTLTRIRLKNGSTIHSLPAGRTGYFIRGFTVDHLIADEAAYIPETVWNAILPALATTKAKGFGWITLLSTPFGRGGYFYHTFTDKNFTSFHVSSEDCKRIDKKFLALERRRMTKMIYAQEYLGEFTEQFNQFFPTPLIKKCMSFIEWNRQDDGIKGANYYLGQDLARYGGDETAYVFVEEYKKRLKVVKCMTRTRVSSTATVGETSVLHDSWKFRKIFTDSGGLGGPVLDQLQEKIGKRTVVGLDNSSKGIVNAGEVKRAKILKEDLYSNTLMLMETGRLDIINDLDLLRSMKSITFEYKSDKKLKIFGPYSHLTEALIRACWCMRERGLSLYVY